MSTVKVNEVKHLSNTGTANIVLESNATTNLQATSTLGLTVTGTLTVSGVSTFNGNTVVGNASSDTMSLISTVSGFNNFSGFTGEIRMYAGNAAGDAPPAGWLYCNGDTMSETSGDGGTHYNADGKGNDYQALFNLLKASSDWGNSSSAAWGTNTIKTPDFRSRSPVGIHTGAATSITAGLTSRTLSDAVGTETHALIIAELAVHNHVTTAADSPANSNITISTITADQATHRHTGTTDPTTPIPTGGPNTPSTGDQSASHTHTATQGYNAGSEENHGLGAAWGGEGVFDSSQHINNQSASHTHSMQSHTHTSAAHTHTFTSGYTDPAITVSGGALGGQVHTHVMTSANAAHSGTSAAGTAHTILSPIIAVNYIIKV
jgi:microcystin-dependent protein